MRLVVWLPLNNSLKNNGLLGGEAVGTANFLDIGKVTAKSLRTNSSITISNIGIDTKAYSIATWVYVDPTATSWQKLFSYTYTSSASIESIYAVDQARYKFDRSNLLSTYVTVTGWHHLVYTFNNGILSAYVDGSFINSTNAYNIDSTINQITIGGGNSLNSINDFRVYDEVISPTEIKKLAQGLACHFTFNFEDFYTPVDYLESDGNQYINTGFTKATAASTDTFIIEANVSSIDIANGSRKYMFGFNNPGHSHYADFNGTGHYGSYDCYSTAAFSSYTIYPVKMKINGGSSTNYYINGTLTSTDTTYQSLEWGTFNLFCINTSYMGNTIRIYSAKMYYNGELVRDYMPCVRKTDNKPGFYDWVTNTFYSKTGSGTDFKAPYYAAVEYITADSNAYINTGYKIKTENMMVDFKCKLPSSFNGLSFFGSNNSTPLYDLVPYHADSYGSYIFQHWIGSSSGILNVTYSSDINNVLYTISNNTLVCNINGEQSSTSFSGSIKSNQDFYIFGKHGSNGSAERANGYTLYYLKLYDNGILVRDFIPAINLLTNEIGLYDNVENKFYSNASSSGSFSAPSVANTHMVDCSGYLIDGVGSNITESKDTAWGNSCAVFNGTNSHIDGNIGLTDNMTFACWINFNAGSSHIIDCRATTNGTGYQPMYGGPNYGLQFWSTNDTTVNTHDTWTSAVCGFNTNTWYHLVVTVTTNYAELFINGKSKGKVSGNFGYNFGSRPIKIGTRVDNTTWLDGKIADLRIYSTVLSNNDIQALYQGRAELDNRLNLYGGNFIEEDRIYELTKENVLFAEEFNEEPGNFKWEDKDSYHELEYIESTGTQYINTGIISAYSIRTMIDYQYTRLNGSYNRVFGTSYLSGSQYGLRGSTSSGGVLHFETPGTTAVDTATTVQNNFWYDIDFNNNREIYINNTYQGIMPEATNVGSQEIYLCAHNTTSGPVCSNIRIKSCKMYDGDILIRNFVPVKWDTTGEIGLYDTVEKKFYTNDGTGEFIAGENRYQRLEYIQSTGTQYIDTGYYHHTAKTNYKWGMMLKGLPASSVVYHSPFGARTTHESNDAYYMGINHTDMHCYGCIGGYKQDPFNPNLILSNDIYYEGEMDHTSGLYINGNYYSMPGREGRLSSFSCYVFAGNWNGTADEFFWGRIYYLKIYDIGTLVRDFIPVRDKKTGEVGLFDKVSSTFYANRGSGDFIAGPEARYEELEYIESNGTQYIDTGLMSSANMKFDIKTRLITENNTDKILIGGRSINTNRFWIDFDGSSSLRRLFNGLGSYYTWLDPYAINTDYHLIMDAKNSKGYINGVESDLTNTYSDTNKGRIYMFCANNQGTTGFFGSFRVYGCRIYDNNILVRDFIPVKNSETGEVGLFDKVESIFYTNQGTGNFIAGPATSNLEINKGRWVVGQLIEE